MVGKDLIMATLFGSGGGSSGSGGGGSGGGAWIQTGTIVHESDTTLSNKACALPIDDSNGTPDLIYVCRDDEEGDTSHETDDFFSAIAAPSILKKAYMYGILYGKYHLPYVVDNSNAMYKDVNTGLYYPVKPSWSLSVKMKAGVVYRWIAIGGLSE